MDDEIKKILEKPNVYSFADETYLYFGDYNKIKDCITNLQKEVRVNNDLISHFKNRVKELKKEITNLQKENDYYFKKNNELSTLNTSLRNARDDYKSRCEKSSEIIKKEKEIMGYAKYDSCLLLIENILQNGSDNNV